MKKFEHHEYGSSIEELERKIRDLKIFAKKIMRHYKIPKDKQTTLASTLIGAGRVAVRVEKLKQEIQ